jgi:hypothetical protein
MKKIFLIAIIAALSSCNSSTQKKEDAMGTMSSDSTKRDDVGYPYPVDYTNFEIGDLKHAQTILNIWKAWDNRDLASVKDSFADTLMLQLSDGSIINGSRDSVFSTLQSYQNNFTSIKSSVEAVMSIKGLNKSTNQKENYVAIWGKEVRTPKNGKTDSVWLHEVWLINNEGKTNFVRQYSQAFPKAIDAKMK